MLLYRITRKSRPSFYSIHLDTYSCPGILQIIFSHSKYKKYFEYFFCSNFTNFLVELFNFQFCLQVWFFELDGCHDRGVVSCEWLIFRHTKKLKNNQFNFEKLLFVFLNFVNLYYHFLFFFWGLEIGSVDRVFWFCVDASCNCTHSFENVPNWESAWMLFSTKHIQNNLYFWTSHSNIFLRCWGGVRACEVPIQKPEINLDEIYFRWSYWIAIGNNFTSIAIWFDMLEYFHSISWILSDIINSAITLKK